MATQSPEYRLGEVSYASKAGHAPLLPIQETMDDAVGALAEALQPVAEADLPPASSSVRPAVRGEPGARRPRRSGRC